MGGYMVLVQLDCLRGQKLTNLVSEKHAGERERAIYLGGKVPQSEQTNCLTHHA